MKIVNSAIRNKLELHPWIERIREFADSVIQDLDDCRVCIHVEDANFPGEIRQDLVRPRQIRYFARMSRLDCAELVSAVDEVEID
jgi:hypothetical protein